MGRTSTPARLEELLEQARRKGILLVGDIHDDRRLHQKILGFLEDWGETHGKHALFVEFLGIQDREELERFNNGEIEAATLIRSNFRRWPDSWLHLQEFDPPFYRQVLRICRSYGIILLPMEPIPRLPLRERDKRMARSIAQFRNAHPKALIAVLVGHTHLLGDGHLVSILANQPGFPPAGEIPLLLPLFPGDERQIHGRLGKVGTSYFYWNPPLLEPQARSQY